MYITVKVRMKPNKKAKESLLQYESLYQSEIHSVADHMQVTNKIAFQCQHIDTAIERYSQWNLYQLAHKKYFAIQNKKGFHYQRSSTWNAKSFCYYDGTLVLYFGTTFPISCLTIELSILKNETASIQNNRIIRLDITHDEKFWYANFVVQRADFIPRVNNCV